MTCLTGSALEKSKHAPLCPGDAGTTSGIPLFFSSFRLKTSGLRNFAASVLTFLKGKQWPVMLLVLLMVLTACAEKKQTAEVLRPVRYQKVYATGGERSRTFSGVAQAGVESRLSFRVGGTVRRLVVAVGDNISAGALIAELDPGDFQLQVQQAEASLESAHAQERNAKSSYERVRQLYENRNASRNDLDAARAAFESAGAQVRALEQQLALARSQLSYTRLTAPVNGAIASVDVEINENVQAGQTIVQLSSGVNIEVKVAIPEILISRVREGQPARVEFDALAGQTFPARITEVGVASTGFATTFPVMVRLTGEEQKSILPGMAAEVTLEFAAAGEPERILVPPLSVCEDRSGRFVFTVEAADSPGVGIVHRRAVNIGELTDDGIEILDGLVDGSMVITAGFSKLSDGQKVKL